MLLHPSEYSKSCVQEVRAKQTLLLKKPRELRVLKSSGSSGATQLVIMLYNLVCSHMCTSTCVCPPYAHGPPLWVMSPTTTHDMSASFTAATPSLPPHRPCFWQTDESATDVQACAKWSASSHLLSLLLLPLLLPRRRPSLPTWPGWHKRLWFMHRSPSGVLKISPAMLEDVSRCPAKTTKRQTNGRLWFSHEPQEIQRTVDVSLAAAS